jgi:hypothetical protein
LHSSEPTAKRDQTCGVRDERQLGDVAGLRRLGPREHVVELALLPVVEEPAQLAARLGLGEAIEADVVVAPLEQRERERPRQHAREHRQVLADELLLERDVGRRDDDALLLVVRVPDGGHRVPTLLPVPQGPSPRAWRPPRMASSTMRASATWPSRIS